MVDSRAGSVQSCSPRERHSSCSMSINSISCLPIWPTPTHTVTPSPVTQLPLSQPIFAFEKSISGCSFINFCNSSFFLLSSLVGFPCLFISWSYIIFSTIPLVSPSSSDSLLFSGVILVVSILGADVMMWAHQYEPGALARWMEISLPVGVVSRVQVESSTWMG
jgi:hypothetical protein